MAEMASEQIRRATRDGRAGLVPSVYDEESGPTSPITDREESVLMNEAVDDSVRLEQTGERDDAEVLQAVNTLASMSTERTDREKMPPPGGVMRAKIALGLARTSSSAAAESVSDANRVLDHNRPIEDQLRSEELAELHRQQLKVGTDQKAVWVARYLLELDDRGIPYPLEKEFATAIRQQCSPAIRAILQPHWLKTYPGWLDGLNRCTEFRWASHSAGLKLRQLDEDRRIEEEQEQEESMDMTDEAEKLPLLTAEEFAGASAALQLTDSVEEDERIRKERLRDEEELSATATLDEELAKMKAEADDAKKKQKALADKIRKMEKDKRAKEKKPKKVSTVQLEASKVVESDAEEFTPVKTTRSTKRKNKKNRKPEADVTPTPDATDDESNTSVSGAAPGDDPADEDSVDSDVADVPSSQSESAIWQNARSGFKDFIPQSLEECRKNKSFYACPEEYDREDESDDEEWLRQTRKDPSENRHINVLIGRIKNAWSNLYYTKEHRAKLMYALNKFSIPNNDRCPFEVCTIEAMEPKRYTSQMRFNRHVLEVHMHHHPRYVCVKESGRLNEKCEGLNTCRRSDLIRHLRKQHGKSMVVAYNITMKVHALLMSPANLNDTEVMKEVTSSTKIWGNVCGSSKSKQCARFGLSHVSGRLHLTPDKHDEALRAAGVIKPDVSKRSSEDSLESNLHKRPRGGGGNTVPRKGYQGSSFRGGQTTLHRTPSPVGNQYRGPQTDFSWSSRPGYRNSNPPQHFPVVPVVLPDNSVDEFPALEPAGAESQTLSRTGKQQRTPSAAASSSASVGATASIPADAIQNKVHKFPNFFENVQQVSAEIQKEAFDKWQCKQRELFVDLSQNMAALTLNTLTEIQQRELVRISDESNSLVKGKLEEVEAVKTACRDDVNYIKDEMRELREDLEAMNMKFHRAFGVVMKRWDGTRAHALELLRSKEAQENPTVPRAPPVPATKSHTTEM